MANVIPITVENPDELLNAGAYGALAIVRLQSGAAEGGPFTNEATATILAATRSYTLYDQDGTSSTWYRTRYENAGGTVVSDWSAAFQAGDETGGLICSTYDVEQRLGSPFDPNGRELALDLIRQVTTAIEGYTGRWFAPRPLAGTKTFTISPGFDFSRVLRDGRTVLFPRGIRSISSIGYAVVDQPTTGGSYTSITATDAILPLGESEGWPATRIVLREQVGCILRPGLNVIQFTGAAGWSAVPADIQGIGADAVIRKWIGKETAAPAVAVGPSGAVTILRGMSPEAQQTLDWYRADPV